MKAEGRLHFSLSLVAQKALREEDSGAVGPVVAADVELHYLIGHVAKRPAQIMTNQDSETNCWEDMQRKL